MPPTYDKLCYCVIFAFWSDIDDNYATMAR